MIYEMSDETNEHECGCGELIEDGRWDIGYRVCLKCGDSLAKQKKFCVVPLNKSNYYLVSDPELLKQLNPKRTI